MVAVDDLMKYEEAMKSAERKDWKRATKEELESYREQQHVENSQHPGMEEILYKVVLKRILDENARVDRYNAHVDPEGYAQTERVFYGESFAPVGRIDVASHLWKVHCRWNF